MGPIPALSACLQFDNWKPPRQIEDFHEGFIGRLPFAELFSFDILSVVYALNRHILYRLSSSHSFRLSSFSTMSFLAKWTLAKSQCQCPALSPFNPDIPTQHLFTPILMPSSLIHSNAIVPHPPNTLQQHTTSSSESFGILTELHPTSGNSIRS